MAETVEELKAQLQDAQESLASALARIHTLKLREKKLLEENAKLRARASGESDPATEDTTAIGSAEEEEPDTHHDIYILRNNRKVPGSLVIAKDHLDLIAIEARIKKSKFVGISSHKRAATASEAQKVIEQMPSAEKAAWMCCLSASAIEYEQKSQPQAEPKFDSLPVVEDRLVELEQPSGLWKMIWTGPNDTPEHLVFEVSNVTLQVLNEKTEAWLSGKESVEPIEDSFTAGSKLEMVRPTPLPAGKFLPSLTEPSVLLSEAHLRCLAAAMPPRHQQCNWGLVYATHRHGISLNTMYRRASGVSPTVLVVKDEAGYIFGAFTPEPWRLGPRFYGTGETFVFQLEPHRVMYPWKRNSRFKNDFFQLGSPDCLAVGGAGRPAVWVEGELLRGSSGCCATFGSPSLSFQEDFRIASLELWQAL